MLKFVAVFGVFASVALAAPAATSQDPSESRSFFEDAISVYTSCQGEADLSVCLKLKALRFVDRAARSADISVIDGFKIVQTEEAKASRADNARSLNDIESTLPAETDAREAAVDEALSDRAARFLSTHTLELSLPKDLSRSFGEARGKKKLIKTLLPLLLLVKLKVMALVPILLGGLALLAFKALVVSKIALIISAIIGLQKLLAAKNQSYEVVAHPVSHGHEEHHDHHGWARSAGSDLAYNAYRPVAE